MLKGEAMEFAAGLIGATAAYVLSAAAGAPLVGLGVALLVVAALVAYAAQTHAYGGGRVRRAESS